MKKSLFVLLALAFCLTACTPAVSTAPESETDTATAEAAVTDTAGETQPGTFAVVGQLREVDDANLQGYTLYTVDFGDTPADTTFVKVDFTANRQTPICPLGDWGSSYMGWVVKGDSFYYLIYDEDGNALLHSRSLLDGSETVWQLATGQCYPVYLDDRYLYFSRTDYSTVMKRVDLTTGVLEDLPLPAQTVGFWDVEGGRFLISRLLSPVPIDGSRQDSEQYDALLQNADIEYSWWDPATGAMEKVLREPYYGEKDAQGNWVTRIYLGKAEGKLYFYRASATQMGMQKNRVECCNLDGSQVERVFSLPEYAGAPSTLKREGEIYWFLQPIPNGLQIYLPESGAMWEVTAPAGESVPWPEWCLSNGMLVLSPLQGSYRVVSQQDYLAGNFTGSEVTLAED